MRVCVYKISLVLPSRAVNLEVEKEVYRSALSFIRKVLPASRSQNGTSESEWMLESFLWSSYRRPQRFTENVCRAVRRLTMIFPFTLFRCLLFLLPPPYIRSRMYTVYIILHTFCLLFSGYVMLYLFSRLGAQSTQARLIRRLCDYIDILLSQIGKVRAMGQSKKRKRKKRGKSI